ncbi:MAG: ThuA domain-containing protein [Thermomicrobiales bacterium]|nr:ThuA domain-containing protein [Thermomicrobiales bacterium]
MIETLRVVVWNEYRHEREDARFAAVYPKGIHAAIAEGLTGPRDLIIETATLDEPEHGLTAQRLAETDVLIWWGHKAHGEVADEVAARVQQRVLDGMGLIVLHSGHFSKVFKRLMGTSCDLKWRVGHDRERLWVVNPGHPIAAGIGERFALEQEEMYGEHFDIPAPDELVFISWFTGGEVFRSGCCFYRGAGKVFYFRPGHESFPTYYDPTVRRVLVNAVRWAAPSGGPQRTFGNAKPLEAIAP